MPYPEAFSKLVEQCLNYNTYIGIGNPNAKILMVGKEAAIDPKELDNKNYQTNAKEWRDIIDGEGENHLRIEDIEVGHYLRNSGTTWRKYQLLHDTIYQEDPKRNGKTFTIDFMRHMFTTEMSDAPHKTTHAAQSQKGFKENLHTRRSTFFQHPFIQGFPVVVLGCSNYIRNDGKHAEIDDTFGVKFAGRVDVEDGSYKFWLHHSIKPAKPKLVIHCRQLSGAISNAFLNSMGEVIRDFMIEHELF